MELAQFLKARRDAIRPSDVGLPNGDRRRTNGLRREEVAILAGVSPTWYTYLEQGRKIRPSSEVIASLARVLKLSPDEQRYLFMLALGQAPAIDDDSATLDEDDVWQVVEAAGHGPDPVYAGNWLCDVVAWNQPAVEWYTDWGALEPPRRNMLWWMLNDPVAKERLVDWERETRDVIARLRAASALRRDREHVDTVLDVLRENPDFERWWDTHDVRGQGARNRVMQHPEHGRRSFRLTVLCPRGQEEYMIVMHPRVDLPEDR